jgi:hypothetical protein
MEQKPKKFYKATAFLPVIDLKETLAYYKSELGFYEEWIWQKIDGGIRRDEMRLIFGEDAEYTRVLNSGKRAFELIWFVDSVDQVYKEFTDRKIPLISDIGNKPWGIREFTIKDNNGYLIRVSESIDLSVKS